MERESRSFPPRRIEGLMRKRSGKHKSNEFPVRKFTSVEEVMMTSFRVFYFFLKIVCVSLWTIILTASLHKSLFSTPIPSNPAPPRLPVKAMPLGKVKLANGLFQDRYNLNRKYVLSLKNENLLQNFYWESGVDHRVINQLPLPPDEDIHWGWESPTCQVRGHFLGHWLSAASRMAASTGDAETKAKADWIIKELARCQSNHGGEWASPMPESFMDLLAAGRPTWAPQYVHHKTLMGLYDMYDQTGNPQALEVMEKMAAWFYRWTGKFTREKMDEILDTETGGMLENWANLYGVTSKNEHLELVYRYDRPHLFDRLLAGEDPLTNRHANTTIPEIQGAARAYEVTGDPRWRKIVEAYWKCAVTDRGYFATGGQSSGEVWTPPFELAARLGSKDQEHCVVYNMMRLADYLFRWTGDVRYADYIERNLYNGILAQQNPKTGMVAYFLGLQAGAKKAWGTPTHDFWCCHGSLVQAHTFHNAYVYYSDQEGLFINQYIPTELTWEWNGVPATVKQSFNPDAHNSQIPLNPDGPVHRPARWVIDLEINTDKPVEFALKIRLPFWMAGKATLLINGHSETVAEGPSSYHVVRRTWNHDKLRLELPKSLWTCPLPDLPGTVAFMDGPVVLAGLCGEERTLAGDPKNPSTLLIPDDERQWGTWNRGYRTNQQERGIYFKPLYEIVDETYSVYFPVRPGK
jgi:uncharacterized protein